jgi:hypothetical protein
MDMSNETVETIEAEVMPVARQGAEMVVRNAGDYDSAIAYIKENKAAQARAKEVLDPICDAANKAHKAATALRNRILDPLLTGERRAKAAATTWAQEQERIRQAEQRRLQAEAEEAARRERERLEKQAAKLKTPELREERLEQAAQVVAPVVTVAPVVQKVAGAGLRKTWKARVVDVDKVPRSFMIVNDGALQAYARATKGAAPVAGVEFYEDSTMSVRGA